MGMLNAAAAAAAATVSSKTLNYNYNNENPYSKDDMSAHDDINSNNNRLNLRHSSNITSRSNAFEERNIYVSNNGLSDNANSGNDSVKSYIHIEVYKGNLENGDGNGGTVTVKPKESKPMRDVTAFASKSDSIGAVKGDGGSGDTLQLHHINPLPNGIIDLSSTATKT